MDCLLAHRFPSSLGFDLRSFETIRPRESESLTPRGTTFTWAKAGEKNTSLRESFSPCIRGGSNGLEIRPHPPLGGSFSVLDLCALCLDPFAATL